MCTMPGKLTNWLVAVKGKSSRNSPLFVQPMAVCRGVGPVVVSGKLGLTNFRMHC